MSRLTRIRRNVRLAVVALSTTLMMTMAAAGAAAAPPEKGPGSIGGPGKASPDKAAQANCSVGRSIPRNKISIQLWTFSRVIRDVGIEAVLAHLSEVGYRNIEPYSFHGLTAEEFADLAKQYGLKVPSRHMSTSEANWDANLADAKLLGQRWVGSGGFAAPGIGSYENTLATAETLNRLGERSVKNGTGKIFGHNHAGEFTTRYVDVEGDGQEKSAWQILVENTDPRWVTFQLDVGWATIAGEDPVQLIEDFGDRIELLHVKDVRDVGTADQTQTTVGEGDVDWEGVFAAAQGKVKQYIVEQDPPVEPFSMSEDSFEYLDCLSF